METEAPAASLTRPQNPLNKPVGLICDNPEHIVENHVSRLMAALPEHWVKRYAPAGAVQDETMSAGLNTLYNQLQTLMRAQDRLMRQAQASSDPEISKRAIASGKDLFNLFSKFEQQIDRQARQRFIETSVKEAFAELGRPDIEELFLKLLYEKLKNAAKSA